MRNPLSRLIETILAMDGDDHQEAVPTSRRAELIAVALIIIGVIALGVRHG